MKVRELIEYLEAFQPEADVMLLTQQHYPLMATVAGVTSNIEVEAEGAADYETFEHPTYQEGDETVVYILEGANQGYGSRAAWDAARR